MTAADVNKSDLLILERAYKAEITGQRYRGSARRIEALVAKGYLVREHGTHLGFAHEWIELTHLGRMTYCMSCPAPTEEEENSP